jgi:hypothetical protein
MLNQNRFVQIRAMIEDHGWDALLLYGHSWRKEHFRSLINLNFHGPHAVVAVTRGGDINILVSDPWDQEVARAITDARITLEPQLSRGLTKAFLDPAGGVCAVAGLELMEAEFAQAIQDSSGHHPISASREMEELRRAKSADEI